jgi:hypothetical protein
MSRKNVQAAVLVSIRLVGSAAPLAWELIAP